MRRLLLVLLVPVLLVVGGQAGPALAGSVEEVVRGLSSDGVHVDPEADLDVDEEGLRSAALGAPVPLYVAVLPASAGSGARLSSLVVEIGTALGDSGAAVLVVTDAGDARADNGTEAGERGVDAGEALEGALAARGEGALTASALTGLVAETARRMADQAGGTSPSSGSGLLGPLLVVGALGVAVWLVVGAVRRRRAGAQQLEDLRADVESLYGRLGSDVSLLSPGDDAVARQALADASERYGATGALMSTADSPGEWAAARRTAIEGITAARVVRQRLGLDLGPDLPPLPSSGVPRLAEPTAVEVGDQVFEGSPDYEPGRPHWFEGGYSGTTVVPGGWYATPFWQALLLSGALGGGHDGYAGGRRRVPGGFGGVVGGSRRSGGSGGFGGFGGGGSWGRRGGGGGGGKRSGGSW